MSISGQYSLVRLANGEYSVRSLADGETFHPGIGPVAEAEALYVRQLRLPERVRESAEEFVIWDVGLGAAANALVALRFIRDGLAGKPAQVRMISFDRTGAAASFALHHAVELTYLAGFETILADLLAIGRVQFNADSLRVEWSFVPADFPLWLANEAGKKGNLPSPHAILFDPHSPQRNPEMWTVSLFAGLFHALDPKRPCTLATFTRSTMARTAMLLGGFQVGIGRPTGLKEETTVAANRLELLDEPLEDRWLDRARRSHSAQPLDQAVYQRSRLTEESLARLRAHPQFTATGPDSNAGDCSSPGDQ